MRRSSRYSAPRRKWPFTASLGYGFLAAAAIGALAWLWWQQRIPTPALMARTTPPAAAAPDLPSPAIAVPPPAPPPASPIPTPAVDLPPREPEATNGPLPRLPEASGPTNSEPAIATPPAAPVATNRPPPETNPPLPPGLRLPRNTLELQVALARNGISAGCLDGRDGSQTRAAVRAFQEREKLATTGQADVSTKIALAPFLQEPPERVYLVTSNDLSRLTPVGRTWLSKSQQDRLDYETILELVAELGQAHPGLIRTWNRSIDWTRVVPGTPVALPNVQYPPPRKARFVRIRLSERTLAAFDSRGALIAHFPCSIARNVDKRPVGELLVEKVASMPSYRFDPDIFPESAEARELGRKLMIPPGPNNPVGTAWIGLNKPGYGIHGTPRPEEVGRTESHGCFRLANWNADYLLQMVSVGMPVLVEP